jgi:predicted 3-demethylubiquinone-9 3-methyltransferase (glyoxalase superfamily)
MQLQKITPFPWFDKEAEETANFYTSLFVNSKILKRKPYGEARPGPAGAVISQCGWLKDRHGLSWRVVPVALSEVL